jgi:hypothetical protein
MKGVCFPYAIRLFVHRGRAISRFECLGEIRMLVNLFSMFVYAPLNYRSMLGLK